MNEHELRAREILGRLLRTDPALLRAEDRLREDLGADSLHLVELIYDFEEAFQTRIPDERAVDIRTVGDIFVAIEQGRTRDLRSAAPGPESTVPGRPGGSPA